MTRSAVSWDEFDRRRHPPVDGTLRRVAGAVNGALAPIDVNDPDAEAHAALTAIDGLLVDAGLRPSTTDPEHPHERP